MSFFDFFRSPKNAPCPLSETRKSWLEPAFRQLLETFPYSLSLSQLRPLPNDFPFTITMEEEDAFNLLPVLAQRLEVDPDIIELQFYDQSLISFSGWGARKILSAQEPEDNEPMETYDVREQNGKYIISLLTSLTRRPERLISRMAHELAQVKLLLRYPALAADNRYADVLTVLYGLGIFNANASVAPFTGGSPGDARQGALIQQEWGYALALYAQAKKEGRETDWTVFLAPNIKSDFKKSMAYLQQRG